MSRILRPPTRRAETSRLRCAWIRAKATEHRICGRLLRLLLLLLLLLRLLLTKCSRSLAKSWGVQVKRGRKETRDTRNYAPPVWPNPGV